MWKEVLAAERGIWLCARAVVRRLRKPQAYMVVLLMSRSLLVGPHGCALLDCEVALGNRLTGARPLPSDEIAQAPIAESPDAHRLRKFQIGIFQPTPQRHAGYAVTLPDSARW